MAQPTDGSRGWKWLELWPNAPFPAFSFDEFVATLAKRSSFVEREEDISVGVATYLAEEALGEAQHAATDVLVELGDDTSKEWRQVARFDVDLEHGKFIFDALYRRWDLWTRGIPAIGGANIMQHVTNIAMLI